MAGNVLPGTDTTSDCGISGNPLCGGRPHFPACEVHGTAVAGTAVGLVGNSLGTAGIAPNLKVVPIRIGRSVPFANGVCFHTSEPEWVANGLLAALALGVRVTNLSWNYGTNPDPAMRLRPKPV
jgi:subtilisin family serine protease